MRITKKQYEAAKKIVEKYKPHIRQENEIKALRKKIKKMKNTVSIANKIIASNSKNK